MMKFTGFNDRRCTLRIPRFSPASYTNGLKFGKGTVENVGPDGMFLKTTGQFFAGEKLNIEFNFRHSRQKMNLKGKIVRLANDGLGVEFLWS
jgi:hypothetical protein